MPESLRRPGAGSKALGTLSRLLATLQLAHGQAGSGNNVDSFRLAVAKWVQRGEGDSGRGGKGRGKGRAAAARCATATAVLSFLHRMFDFCNRMSCTATAYTDVKQSKRCCNMARRDEGAGWATRLSAWCFNPALIFADLAAACRSVVLTSGTLSPLDSFAAELGAVFDTRLEAPHVVDMTRQVGLQACILCWILYRCCTMKQTQQAAACRCLLALHCCGHGADARAARLSWE